MTTTHVRTCPLCEATCGLEVTVDAGSVTHIRGDKNDVFSKGFICPKGSTLHHLHDDPDRLHAPMVRENGRLREAGWDEAFAAAERGLAGVIERHGRDAVALYAGNPAAHGHEVPLMLPAVVKAFATRNLYTASTVDQMPKHTSCGLMFGRPDMIPVPDVDRTDFLLVVGANPMASNGSLCTAPDMPGRIKAIRDRGGRVVVVDPRRTETARKADEHVPIRPGTDVFLLLSIAHVILGEGRESPGRLAGHLAGLDELRDLVRPYAPEETEALTGVPAAVALRLAREIADAPSAAVYDRIGAHTVEFGTLTSWMADAITAITGNLDEPGGKMFTNAPHAHVDGEVPGGRGFSIGRFHSRVRGLPEVWGQLPVATLADEIEEPGEGQVRALVTFGGNPALSTPNGARLDAALGALEFMVCVDPALNETTRHADVILPPPSPLERGHYDVAFYGLSVRRVANFSPPLFEARGPAEWEILGRLGLIAFGAGRGGTSETGSDPAIVAGMVLGALISREVASPHSPLFGRDPAELQAALAPRSPIEQVLDFRLRAGPDGDHFGARPGGLSLAVLEENPHGVDLGPLEPVLPGKIRTATGKVELAPEPVVRDMDRLAAAFAARRAAASDGGLVLVGRRHLRSNNSWMHNVRPLVGGTNRFELHIHPADAEAAGLADGDTARIASRAGAVEAPVKVTPDILAGVVSLPHGWGHGREGTRGVIAAAHAGESSNVLTDELVIDALSGNAVLNAIPVTVTVAAPAPAPA